MVPKAERHQAMTLLSKADFSPDTGANLGSPAEVCSFSPRSLTFSLLSLDLGEIRKRSTIHRRHDCTCPKFRASKDSTRRRSPGSMGATTAGLFHSGARQGNDVVRWQSLMPDQTHLATPAPAFATPKSSARRRPIRIDMARMPTGVAPDDENLVALRIRTDVHADRVHRRRKAVHEALAMATTGYAIH